jgi:diacylglycerol kinase (ATP)
VEGNEQRVLPVHPPGQAVSGKPANKGVRRVLCAFRYSWQGLRAAWRNEEAFRQECLLAAVMVPAAVMLAQTPVQFAFLVSVCLVVLITELLNSAIEAVVDRIGSESHKLAGRAKDMGSAAVLLSLVLAGLSWTLVALQRYLG